MPTITLPGLERLAFRCLLEWRDLIEAGRHKAAQRKAKWVVQYCLDTLAAAEKPRDWKVREGTRIIGILFRGCEEFSDLSAALASLHWQKKPKAVEKAWWNLCNARDRVRHCRDFYDDETLPWILDGLDAAEEAFRKAFGPGLYLDPQIDLRKAKCSICGGEIGQCYHMPGNRYGALLCRAIPEEFDVRAVSLAETPSDPRCRVWPWHYKAGGAFEGTVVTKFAVDDFLPKRSEGQADKGSSRTESVGDRDSEA